jgi:hypothetical protein
MLDILFSPSQSDGTLNGATSNGANVNPESAALLGLIYLIILMLTSILSIVATVKLYRKIGVHPLVILVPIYNFYVFYKAFGVRRWFWAISLSYIAVFAITYAIYLQNPLNPATIAILYVLVLALSILVMLGSLHYTYNMARSFGKGFSFFCGLLIFAPLFYLILAFGRSDYIGAPD